MIGIVADVREMGLKRPAPPVVYTLIDQMPQPVLKLIHAFVPVKWVIRTQPGTKDLSAEIRDVVRPLDPAQPFQVFKPMTVVVADTMRTEQLLTGLLGAFAVLALVIAAGGLYGTLAYSVQQRRREIGVRIALGAGAMSVLRLVVRTGLAQVGTGLAVGLCASYWTTGVLRSFLFNLSAADPATLGVAAAMLLAVGCLAGFGPALTAVRVDPATSLRTD